MWYQSRRSFGCEVDVATSRWEPSRQESIESMLASVQTLLTQIREWRREDDAWYTQFRSDLLVRNVEEKIVEEKADLVPFHEMENADLVPSQVLEKDDLVQSCVEEKDVDEKVDLVSIVDESADFVSIVPHNVEELRSVVAVKKESLQEQPWVDGKSTIITSCAIRSKNFFEPPINTSGSFSIQIPPIVGYLPNYDLLAALMISVGSLIEIDRMNNGILVSFVWDPGVVFVLIDSRGYFGRKCFEKCAVLSLAVEYGTKATAVPRLESQKSHEAPCVLDIVLRQDATKQGCLPVRQSFHNGLTNFADREREDIKRQGSFSYQISHPSFSTLWLDLLGGEHTPPNHVLDLICGKIFLVPMDSSLGNENGMGNCKDLKSLILDSNYFIGKLPDALVGISSLELMSLQENMFAENLSDRLCNLSGLWVVDVSFTVIDGALLDVFRRLRRLEQFPATSNSLNGHLPISMSNISTFQLLGLRNNTLFGEVNLHCGILVLLFSDSSISILCHVVPFGSFYVTAAIDELYKDAHNLDLDSSNPQVVHNSSLAFSWLEAAFPKVTDQVQERNKFLALTNCPDLSLHVCMLIRGFLRRVNQHVECKGQAISFFFITTSKVPVFVLAWSTGQLHIDALADETVPLLGSSTSPRVRADSLGNVAGVARICEPLLQEISSTYILHTSGNLDYVWLGTLLRWLGIVDLVLTRESHFASLATSIYGFTKKELSKTYISREWLLIKRNSFVYILKMIQLSVVAIIAMIVFWRTEMHGRTVEDGGVYLSALFFVIIMFMFNELAELSMTNGKFPIFFKKRNLLLYPHWAYSRPTWILKLPTFLVEVVIWTGMTYYVIYYDPKVGRLFKQGLILLLINQMASGLFPFIGALGRSEIVESTFGSFELVIILMLGRFVVSWENIAKCWIWGCWILSLVYGQHEIAVNEFLSRGWRYFPDGQSKALGIEVLRSPGILRNLYCYWIETGALVVYVLFLNGLLTLGLTLLDPFKKSQIAIADQPLNEQEANRVGYVRNLELSLRSKESLFRDTSNGCMFSHLLPDGSTKSKKGMVLPFQPLSLVFNNFKYSVNMLDKLKAQRIGENQLELHKGVCAAVRIRILLALMGVSGAGKITLMDVLGCPTTGGYIDERIIISGYSKKQETFELIYDYCEQYTICSSHVKTYESLLFYAWLRSLPEVDRITRLMFIKEVMELVELDNMRDSLVGLPYVSRLSNEQRKRLSIVVELVANLFIIFMDELTLDTRGDVIVMRTVYIVDTKRSIVGTTHQPSINIFESFDELFWMKRGGAKFSVWRSGLILKGKFFSDFGKPG